MEDKVIETIRYIKSISKKKPSINRIKTLKISDENVWSIENLPNLLQDICDKGLIELVDDSYKIKQTKKCELVEETIWPNSQIKIPLFLNQRLQFLQESKNPRNHCFYEKAQAPQKFHLGQECTHNLVLFQNLLKEMEEIKRFTKSTERKFEELENGTPKLFWGKQWKF